MFVKGLVLAVTVVAVFAILGSPAASGTGGPDGANPIQTPLFSATYSGGFVPFGYNTRRPYEHIVGKSGLHSRPQRLSPKKVAPALIPILQGQLTADEITQLDRMAVAAGLDKPKIDFGFPNTADVPELVVVYRGQTHVIVSSGVGEEGLTGEQQAHRADVRSIVSWLDARKPGRRVKPRALVAAAIKIDSSALEQNPPKVVMWPKKGTSLAMIGSCKAIGGDFDSTAVKLIGSQNSATRYQQNGIVYQVYARIFIPGDPGCNPLA